MAMRSSSSSLRLFMLTVVVVAIGNATKSNAQLERSGRRLKLLGGLGGSVNFRSNNQALSASVGVTPGYLKTLVSDKVGRRNGGLTAALAYAVDIDPKNWYAYAEGNNIDPNLLRLLSRGPTAEASAKLNRDGDMSGEAYATAKGNVIAFSRAYVHLLEEANSRGIDLASRSQARGTAISEKKLEDASIRGLYDRFYDEYESEAKVLAVVNADVRKEAAKATQKVEASTDKDQGGHHCARVWLKGETVKGVELTQNDLLQRGVDLDMFDC